jgi:glutamyl-tRNA synthetase
MTVRVRFAPSPTGYLHIGGARTALFNYLFARATGGTFLLRIEDTDLERGNAEYEALQIGDLQWLGIQHDEGPDRPGSCGPYRQSERLHLYKEYALRLIDQGRAFYCFCSEEELERKRQEAEKENRAPVYDGTCHQVSKEEAQRRLAAGEKAVIRFRSYGQAYTIHDHVRGEVHFPQGMVGDFVILRANDYPVYNYCCVVDDWLMGITHVIRGEEHLPNTLRQLMLYQGFGVTPPQFAHLSLLVNKERAKLSKRDGAVSVGQYRDDHYLPQALTNYLCLLGWSHPQEKDVFTLDEVIPLFSLDRFVKSSAFYDIEKLKFINGQHLRRMDNAQLVKEFDPFISPEHFYHQQSEEWKQSLASLYKDKINLASEITDFAQDLLRTQNFDTPQMQEINSWETTPGIRNYLRQEVQNLLNQGKEFADLSDFERWSSELKQNLKAKGKFLFMGMRGALTGADHGPDLKVLMNLTPLKVIRQRLQ